MANSLKDMLTSVDWGKMVSGADARNALVGSVLGGALLGGAGLVQKRDPEESKFAPLGDALVGALLGGVAGYGIPKGLALFRDSGTLAPDGDTLKSNYLGWGLGGAAAGAGVIGTSLYKTIGRVKDQLREQALQDRPVQLRKYQREVDRLRRIGAPKAELLKAINRERMLHDSPLEAAPDRVIAGLRRQRLAAILARLLPRPGRHGLWSSVYRRVTQGAPTDAASIRRLGQTIDELKGIRSKATRGYSGLRDLLRSVASEAVPTKAAPNAGYPMGWFDALRNKTWGGTLPFFTHGRHYSPTPLAGIGPRIGTLPRMLLRAGKYAGAGALLGVLAHKLIGPSSSGNFKN